MPAGRAVPEATAAFADLVSKTRKPARSHAKKLLQPDETPAYLKSNSFLRGIRAVRPAEIGHAKIFLARLRVTPQMQSEGRPIAAAGRRETPRGQRIGPAPRGQARRSNRAGNAPLWPCSRRPALPPPPAPSLPSAAQGGGGGSGHRRYQELTWFGGEDDGAGSRDAYCRRPGPAATRMKTAGPGRIDLEASWRLKAAVRTLARTAAAAASPPRPCRTACAANRRSSADAWRACPCREHHNTRRAKARFERALRRGRACGRRGAHARPPLRKGLRVQVLARPLLQPHGTAQARAGGDRGGLHGFARARRRSAPGHLAGPERFVRGARTRRRIRQGRKAPRGRVVALASRAGRRHMRRAPCRDARGAGPCAEAIYAAEGGRLPMAGRRGAEREGAARPRRTCSVCGQAVDGDIRLLNHMMERHGFRNPDTARPDRNSRGY